MLARHVGGDRQHPVIADLGGERSDLVHLARCVVERDELGGVRLDAGDREVDQLARRRVALSHALGRRGGLEVLDGRDGEHMRAAGPADGRGRV
ncbi:MAG TPA: hypothetical protein VFK02_29995 [Kofleriaceae bacterium]|nr:hypothetical protein [Kofleriaceae bacterium]